MAMNLGTSPLSWTGVGVKCERDVPSNCLWIFSIAESLAQWGGGIASRGGRRKALVLPASSQVRMICTNTNARWLHLLIILFLFSNNNFETSLRGGGTWWRRQWQGRTAMWACIVGESKKEAGKDICALRICKCSAAIKLRKYTKKYKRCHPSAPVLKFLLQTLLV